MDVDIGNALAATATPGVAESSLDRLDDRVARAHDRIETATAAREFGYASLALPADTEPTRIRETVAGFDPAAVLTIGIGGSALGADAITTALGLENHYTLDNVDPAYTRQLLDRLTLADTVVNVVSRSGATVETLANFLVVRDAMEDAGVDWTDHTIVTTGTSGRLRDLADTHDLPTCPVPEGVPGRYSALSPVGLLPAAALGGDIEGVLAGGESGRESLAGSVDACPAYAYGTVAYALEQRGATMNAFIPYVEALEPFAEWFAQLWAESLGKEGLGQTPLRALGVTDQHSQLQLYRAGRKDKLITLLRPRSHPDIQIPPVDDTELAYLGGRSLGALRDAEFVATEASLAAAGQPNVRLEIDRVNPHSIGQLIYELEAACIMYGELLGVSTFTQPAVEWGKLAARGLLGDDAVAEADAVADKSTYVID